MSTDRFWLVSARSPASVVDRQRAFHRLHSGRSFRRLAPSCYAREACLPAYKVFVAPPTEAYNRGTTMDQKWRYEAFCLIAETLAGEGCTAVDARKRARMVFADLRDGAEPRRCSF